MSRTDLDPATLAASLRRMAGDPCDSEGGIEWVYEPIQARVLLDIADLLDENAKLREQIHWLKQGDILHVLTDQEYIDQCERERLMQVSIDALDKDNAKLRELAGFMIRCMQKNHDCIDCLVNGELCELSYIESDARELGIEVD